VWDRYQLACHNKRPMSLDYINALFTEFLEIHGDRCFGDDKAVVCGTARFNGQPVAVIGQQRGGDTQERLARNFGMMHPEGYRKALRVMKLASKFRMPIIIFVDTKGAFPGQGAEERGQAEAIARNIRDMFGLEVPIIVVIIGEGASGGALGIGVGDRVLILENAWYSVISPEGCAAILWSDPGMAARAAEALRISAKDVKALGIADEIVEEPNGGAHNDPASTIANTRAAISRHLKELAAIPTDRLMEERCERYRKIGVFVEV
jgi:acetyl-CoA carboxylase carboxyl transferase subunit alpha